MPSFRTTRRFLAPRWLLEGEGGLLGYALDTLKDAFVRRLELGLLARFPQQGPDGTPAPADALAAMGRDRGITKGLFETDADYAARLITWLDEHRTKGNPYTLMRQLAAYTGPGPAFRTVDNSGNWYTRAADGTQTALLKQANWNWDNSPEKWSRFWVIIYTNGLWVPGEDWGDVGFTYGKAETTWGSTATPSQVNGLVGIVQDWKPAGTRGQIILAFDNSTFDPTAPEPDGTWGDWHVYSGSDAVPSRLQSARYIEGVR